jgi:hypothetical protein
LAAIFISNRKAEHRNVRINIEGNLDYQALAHLNDVLSVPGHVLQLVLEVQSYLIGLLRELVLVLASEAFPDIANFLLSLLHPE